MTDDADGVVVTASRYPHGYASIRSLSESGLRPIAAVDDEDCPVRASRHCDETVVIPPPSDLPGYRDALFELARRPDVRSIVPHRPHDPYLLARYRDEFEPHVDVVVPSLERLRTVHDRYRLAGAAEAAGVAMPETELLGEVDDWSRDRIVKARYNLLTDEYIEGFSLADSKIAKTVEHVPAGDPPDREALVEAMYHEPIVQEYVDGEAYLFGALYERGEALGTFQHREIRADSYTGGGGAYRESVDVPALDRAGRAILDELEWHGLACIEYVRDAETGEFHLIEINPRMWQSLACATRAGADVPRWYWLAATGRADEIEPGFTVGASSHYLFGELEHLVSVVAEDSPFVDAPSLPRRTAEVVGSCLLDPRFDFLRRDDPGPFLAQVRGVLGGAIRNRVPGPPVPTPLSSPSRRS